MKRIEKEKNGVRFFIETPWLSGSDAAEYLGISQSTFNKIQAQINHGLKGRIKKYHVDDLDKFCLKYKGRIKGLTDAARGAGAHIGDPG